MPKWFFCWIFKIVRSVRASQNLILKKFKNVSEGRGEGGREGERERGDKICFQRKWEPSRKSANCETEKKKIILFDFHGFTIIRQNRTYVLHNEVSKWIQCSEVTSEREREREREKERETIKFVFKENESRAGKAQIVRRRKKNNIVRLSWVYRYKIKPYICIT